MSKGPPRELDVLAITDVTRNMRRITLGGRNLADFPTDQAGGYVKFFLDYPDMDMTAVRTYTIRYQRDNQSEIDVDFVMHGDHGVASAWALHASVGDTLTVGGPGPKKIVDMDADWYFLVGDMTALPPLSATLEALPASARRYAVIEILHDSDQQDIAAPPGMEVQWVVAADNVAGREAVVERVRNKPWLEGRPSVWAASEFDTMKALRQYFKKERGLRPSEAYISSYWKNGLREDEHKIVKKQDVDSGGA